MGTRITPNQAFPAALCAEDTIVAPITGAGAAAVAVIRISGPLTDVILKTLFSAADRATGQARTMVYGTLWDKLAGAAEPATLLDHALVCYFKGPQSFTGEDSAEISIHGSPYVLRQLLANICAAGARMAAPGEFTKRAFLNGRIDLTQAEAVADLIQAETAAQARFALGQLSGVLSTAVSDLGEPLRDLTAEVEATIDFPDEDIEPLAFSEWGERILALGQKVTQFIGSYESGRLQREGAQLVLAGRPNAGKSSLLNQLVGDERAIVTPIAGTTRDSIEVPITLGGFFVRVWDTAGLNQNARDEVERLGIERSWKRAQNADLLLFVYDAAAEPEESQKLLEELKRLARPIIAIANKADLLKAEAQPQHPELETVFLSAKTGKGVDTLLRMIEAFLLAQTASGCEQAISNERQLAALRGSEQALAQAGLGVSAKQAAELIAADLRHALGCLDEIIGVTSSEDILGRIFSKFCIGK